MSTNKFYFKYYKAFSLFKISKFACFLFFLICFFFSFLLFFGFYFKFLFLLQQKSYYVDSRLNGLNVNTSKTRPRIPTPDVSKESVDKDNTANGKFLLYSL